MAQNAREVVGRGQQAERSVLERVSETLDWPIKIRRRRIREKKMLEAFTDQTRTADQRIAQNQGGIVPNETVPQSRRIRSEHRDCQQEKGEKSFQRANRCGQNRQPARLGSGMVLLRRS